MVGRFREGKVQLPLADEELEILIPQGVWLAVHQLCQAAQREESPLAELQQHIDKHLAFHLALGSGLRGQPFQSRGERRGESLQIATPAALRSGSHPGLAVRPTSGSLTPNSGS